MTFEDVVVEKRGCLGLVTLNRPKALNALTLRMLQTIIDAFDRFESDGDVAGVMICSSGEKAFCAGADVREVMALPPGPELSASTQAFFRLEYSFNHRLHHYLKPVIALTDGFTFGGGCGISLNTSHPVATERTILAMPETVLGLFPDVGASRFYGGLPGSMGLYLGLTGLRINADDALALGLVKHKINGADRDNLMTALGAATALDANKVLAILAEFSVPGAESAVTARAARIDALFGGDSVEDIRDRLAGASESWAQEALAVIDRASPTSLKITLRQMRDARSLSLAKIFEIEFRLAVRACEHPDFREGVRAILIDRDNAPNWRPAGLEDVSEAAVDAWFAPLAATIPAFIPDA